MVTSSRLSILSFAFATLACSVRGQELNPAVAADSLSAQALPGAPPVPCNILLPEGGISATYQTNTWPGGVVPYVFNGVTEANRTHAVAAMSEVAAVSGVRFVPRTTEPYYLRIQNGSENNSSVGRQPVDQQPQAVNIFNWDYHFIVAHELMHAVGFWHEQQRPGRDPFVRIETDHIQSQYRHNFDVIQSALAFGAYDFDSVMHYDQCAFSSCCPAGSSCSACLGDPNCRAITALAGNEQWQNVMGQRTRVSAGDRAGLRFLYPPCDWYQAVPEVPGGFGHAMAYDSARGRVVLFGGQEELANSGDTLEWDGGAWTLRATSGPSARSFHAMAYDSARRRTVLFGGGDGGGYRSDTWEWDGSAWTLRATTGPPREAHAMAYDSARGRVVLFGGYFGSSRYDTWEWDGSTWTRRASSGPSARYYHAMAYDSARGRVVLFGGSDGLTVLGDTWEWDGSAWTLRAASGPPARYTHTMAYDSARGRAVIFGGLLSGISGDDSGDTWEWDGSTWTLGATSGPSARHWQAMAYDSARGRVVLFGGYNGGGYRNDTWEWDATAWTLRSASGPSGRGYHAMAYDSARRRTVLFGGDGGGYRSDTWEWDGSAWALGAVSGPSARARHAVAYDSARGRVVMFGGWDGLDNRGDTWEWDGSVWTLCATAGPTARRDHAMAYDTARGRVVLFGGNNEAYRNDTWEWNGSAWMLRAASGPSARFGHAMAYDSARGRVVLFGGYDGASRNDTWEWDGSTWTLRATSGPSARHLHAMASESNGGRVLLFGGFDGANRNDTWHWDGSAWTLGATAGPTGRWGHAMAYDGSRGRVVLFGGYDTAARDDTWELSNTGAPRISTHPSSRTRWALRSNEFSVVAGTGEPLWYQWRKDGVELSDGLRISGAQTSRVRIFAVVPSDAGAYDVVVTSTCGSTMSNPATLTVESVWSFLGR